MPKDRDRTLNPATAHLKSQKAAALKKSKAAVSVQRTERLSKRNPDRLQRQIDELKATQEAQGGQLRPREKAELEKLERDVKAILKARGGEEDAGGRGGGGMGRGGRDGGGDRGRGRGGGSMLGKRRRHDNDRDVSAHSGHESDTTDPEVRDIPMPRDTPPPIPPQHHRHPRTQHSHNNNSVSTGANSLALPPRPGMPTTIATPTPIPARTTYSSAPQIRDLRKEATSKFVPGAVAARLKASKSGSIGGRYLEPEEVDQLEKAGYIGGGGKAVGAAESEVEGRTGGLSLEEEEAAFERELREVEARDGLGTAGGEVRQDIREDIREVVSEAAKEAEFEMMADEVEGNAEVGGERAEKRLRMVEMEEVEDEG